MKPTYHVIISGGVTAVFALWVKSKTAVLACFLSGIFIDLDHHLDYFLVRKKLPLSYKKLVDFCDKDQGPLYLFLHSYELLILMWICIYYFSLGNVWVGIAVGFTTHILCDEFANPFRPLAYFLTYRIKHKFNRKMLFKKEHFDEIS
jgi:hypothetical protein